MKSNTDLLSIWMGQDDSAADEAKISAQVGDGYIANMAAPDGVKINDWLN